MALKEGISVELKQSYVHDVKKTIIAFANTKGGTIYLGVDDDGEVIGIENPDAVIQQVGNAVRDSIKPDLTMFTEYSTTTMSEKRVVEIIVQRGADRPYYLSDKGLKPSGVYVRQGSSSVPASQEAIRQMIRITDGDIYEDMRSFNQDLTFDYTEKEFLRKGLAFGPAQKQTLGLVTPDGLYTNLGLLLSEQCKHTIKVAYFEGRGMTIFKDRKEFEGSLLQQLEECTRYLDLFNRTAATFEGLYRIDERDYPSDAIMEALLNAIIHREYAYSGSIILHVFEHAMNINSLGGLVPGVDMDSIMHGFSQSRNKKLANIFYRLRLTEAYGTGIRKIFSGYMGYTIQPLIHALDTAFQIVLPNVHAPESKDIYPQASIPPKTVREIPEQYRVLLDYAAKSPRFLRKDVEVLLQVGQTRAIQILRELTDKRFLKKQTAGRNTYYTKE
ncbi:MAG TPA: RNA-binding domain-containing protein [Clostridia bacterium]